MNDEKYFVQVTMRDGLGQIKDDYHATVTRRSDGVQLIWISGWLWLLNLKLKRKRIDRAFARYDKHQAKLTNARNAYTI